MIQSVNNNNIKECVDVIKESFLTVANEFGFTIENAPRFTAFATTEQRLSWQLNNEKFDFKQEINSGNKESTQTKNPAKEASCHLCC